MGQCSSELHTQAQLWTVLFNPCENRGTKVSNVSKVISKVKNRPFFVLSQGILNRPFLLGPEIMPRILQISNTKFLPKKHRKELIQILRHTTVYVFNYTQCLDFKWKFWCLRMDLCESIIHIWSKKEQRTCLNADTYLLLIKENTFQQNAVLSAEGD